jgi:hypothetical protein
VGRCGVSRGPQAPPSGKFGVSKPGLGPRGVASQERAIRGNCGRSVAWGGCGLDGHVDCGDDEVVGVERDLRRVINPWSTRVTMIWQGFAMRRALRSGRPSACPARRVPRPRPVTAAVAFIGPAFDPRQGPIRRSHVAVPDVVGLDWNEAVAVLRDVELTASHSDGPAGASPPWVGGVVTAQQPEAGWLVPMGSSITVWLRRGPGSAVVREPRRPSPGPLSAREAVPEPSEEGHA